MEQARYWMWTKHNNNHPPEIKNPSYYDSWEEQAFAEDAAGGNLGGCVWPPRSYSCSFCRREFRSAQALGGHMNVHRRDRARLKVQSDTTPTQQNENLNNQENHQQTLLNPFLSLRYQYSSHALNPALLDQTTYLHSSRFPAQPMQEKSTKEIVSESFLHVQETQNRSQISAFSPFWSKMVSKKEDIKSSEPAVHKAKDGCMKTDLSCVSLSLVSNKSTDHLSVNPGNMEKAAAGCKRKREDESSQVSFVNLRQTLANKINHVQSEISKLCPSSSEDLDLELRLGDRPKVK